MNTDKKEKLLTRAMPRYNKNNKNDLRNYTLVPHSVFVNLYKNHNNKKEIYFKIIENSKEVKYYVLTKFFKENNKSK